MIDDTRWFKVSEMLATSTGLPNMPSPGSPIWDNLQATMIRMDDVRDLLGVPITVTSGWRSPAVNKRVGGAPTSAHLLGHAVDFRCSLDVRTICEAIIEAGIQFDQLIDELAGKRAWVHISFDPRMRGQVLTQRGGKYLPGLV